MSSFEELTIEEKSKWEEIATNLKSFQIAFLNLCKLKKCIWCSKSFPEGIIRKRPMQDRMVNAYDWFIGEFLAHAKMTHGYDPEIINTFFEKLFI